MPHNISGTFGPKLQYSTNSSRGCVWGLMRMHLHGCSCCCALCLNHSGSWCASHSNWGTCERLPHYWLSCCTSYKGRLFHCIRLA